MNTEYDPYCIFDEYESSQENALQPTEEEYMFYLVNQQFNMLLEDSNHA